MRTVVRSMLVAASLLVLGSGTALACHVEGKVFCYPNGLPLGGVQVQLFAGDPGAGGVPVGDPAVTDDDGNYYIELEGPPIATNLWIVPLLGPGASLQSPAAAVHLVEDITVQDWSVNDPEHCGLLGCWLTGGGAKINRILNIPVAEKGPRVNFGGNVNPGCSPTSGEGGNWNLLDKGLDWHFQISAIQVIECGNVDGIPPGSTSPVTPYNYIIWQGQGRAVKPVDGDVEKGGAVCFLAKAEDRNEPGSSGARDGALVDRFYFEVFECGTTNTLYRIGTLEDPVPITDGNLQLHVSSCSTP